MEWSFDASSPADASASRGEFLAFLERHSEPGSQLKIAEVAFDELVANATRYAPGAVWVQLDWSAPEPVLHVRDHGPGFSLADVLGSGVRGGLQILTELAGPLHVATRRSRGSDVSLTLPVRRLEAPADVHPPVVELPSPEDAAADGTIGKEAFLRALVVQLAQSVELTHGPAAAEAAVIGVGGKVGGRIEEGYRRARALTERLAPQQIADLFVELKAAIGGDFYTVSVSDNRIVLENRRCPFGDVVKQAPSLCRMTSTVFGGIARRNTGEADVILERRIAVGDPDCRVVVELGGEDRRDTDEQGWHASSAPKLRALLAEDTLFLRQPLVHVLADAGVEVVAHCDTPRDVLQHVRTYQPDVAILDFREDQTEAALTVAREVRRDSPSTGVLILSEQVAVERTRELLKDFPTGIGYLLKNRLADVDAFLASVRSVSAGGTEVDPTVLSRLTGRGEGDALAGLTPREIDVLRLIASGMSNDAIADELFVTKRAVEKHISNIFLKLDLPPSNEQERRVLAALTYRDATRS